MCSLRRGCEAAPWAEFGYCRYIFDEGYGEGDESTSIDFEDQDPVMGNTYSTPRDS